MDAQKLNKLKKKCEKRGKHFWRDAGKNLSGDRVSRCDHCYLSLVESD
jgi:hypothetical protein